MEQITIQQLEQSLKIASELENNIIELQLHQTEAAKKAKPGQDSLGVIATFLEKARANINVSKSWIKAAIAERRSNSIS